MKFGAYIDRNMKGKRVKSVICKLPDGTTATLEMNQVNQIIKDKGLDKAGDAQAFHTQNVLRRIKRYMPFVTGVTYKMTVLQTDIHQPYIITDTPYAKYLFYGKKMIDPKLGVAGFMTPEGWRSRKNVPKVVTQIPLKYNRSKNPQAGARWDKAVSVNEGPAMAADLQRFINRRK